MPLYDYQCQACGHVTEVRHGFRETYTDACGACGGKVARVFSAAPIIFNGSGFYVTDSRKRSSPATGEPKKPDAPAADSKTPATAASDSKKSESPAA
ncbi:MAG: FmdB family zinc ribbon protein [Candidatus Velthaea sp.]